MNTAVQKRKKESYKIFDEISETYDFLNHFLSLGIDIYWRNKFLKHIPFRKNIQALDLACGTADVPIVLSKDNRIDSIVGMDLSEGMIKQGLKKIKKKKLTDKIKLQIGDGVAIPSENQSFDLVTISFGIRNFPDAQESLNDIYRVLKKDGRLMIMELSVPKYKFIRSFYFLYFRHILPALGNIISSHGDAYRYLNESVEDFPCGDAFAKMMRKAGFTKVRYTPMTFGIATLYIGDKIEA